MQMQMQMQELQPINGVVNGGSVLLRRTNYAAQPPHAPPQAALKCPRCDSLNTKFCYYNNYNLSQPRHFCKNCRRYWTKGGVLRNVPVGGGCRKSKRNSSSSKSKSHSSSSSSSGKKIGSNSHSSSESSAVDGVSCGGLFHIPEADTAVDGVSCGGLFSDDVGGFINLISNNNNNNNNEVNNDGSGSATASFSEIMQNQEWEMRKIMYGIHEPEEKSTVAVDIGDPTVRIEDLLQNRGSNSVGLSTLDWHLTAGINQGLFDVPDNSNVDHDDYWNQSTTTVHHHHHHHHDPQWSDSTTNHFPLFLP